MIWLSVGYNTILFLAGLQGISKEIYESAEIDGASKFRQFFLLTIPMLKPIILMATVLATINGLGNFNIPNIFFGTSNGPENSALVVGVNLYKTSFEMVDFGKASAIAWTMVFVSVILSAIQFKFGGDKMTKQKIQSRIFTYVIIVFGALIFLMPYLYMIVASTQSNQEILSGGINFKFGDMLLKTGKPSWRDIIIP